MTLNDTKVRNAKPDAKPYKLFDSGGLFLLVTPNGHRWWRFKYHFDGKEKLLSLGIYPDVTLKDARNRRDEARKLHSAGIDPSLNRKAVKSARAENNSNTFEVIAREWLNRQQPRWSESNTEKVTQRLERDIFPWLGKRPISEITAPEMLKVLRRIEDRGAVDTAHRALQNCGQVFRYAIVTGRAIHDLSGSLRGALTSVKGGHFSAITDPKQLGGLLRAINSYQGSPVTRAALQILPLVFVRPGELRHAEWSEFDLSANTWSIPAERMKMREAHLVPLSQQVIKILQELRPITARSRFVFPSARSYDRPMSDNAVLAALRRMGFSKDEMTGHGFRAIARTLLDEVLGVRPDYIEHQLAHAVRDPNGRAYNRTAHLPERKRMMQDWADYLSKLAAETPMPANFDKAA